MIVRPSEPEGQVIGQPILNGDPPAEGLTVYDGKLPILEHPEEAVVVQERARKPQPVAKVVGERTAERVRGLTSRADIRVLSVGLDVVRQPRPRGPLDPSP